MGIHVACELPTANYLRPRSKGRGRVFMGPDKNETTKLFSWRTYTPRGPVRVPSSCPCINIVLSVLCGCIIRV